MIWIRIDEHTYHSAASEDGYIVKWTNGEWTDGDLVFNGTLETGPISE